MHKCKTLKEEYYLCPKSDICVMDCPHKVPHTFDRFCDPDKHTELSEHGGVSLCPRCVKELAADITFFPEDFEV